MDAIEHDLVAEGGCEIREDLEIEYEQPIQGSLRRKVGLDRQSGILYSIYPHMTPRVFYSNYWHIFLKETVACRT